MAFVEFPPKGLQCNSEDTYIPSGESPGRKCQAQLTMSGPPSPDPGVPGVGPTQICWHMAGPDAPDPSELFSGDCATDDGCSVKLVMEVRLNPTDPNHDPKEHYEFWHGKGTYGPPLKPSKDPKWSKGGMDPGGIVWGPPSDPGQDPDGWSRFYVVVTLSTDQCCKSTTATITVTPAMGGPADAVSLTVTLTCTCC
jgi:hypothetical protein